MKQLLITAGSILIIIFIGDALFSEERGKNKPMVSTGTLTETTDLHYTGKYCNECHEKKPVKGKDKFLKFNGDFTQLCRCHGYTAGSYIHPVDVELSEEKKKKIPPSLPLQDGKISCTTCHNIYMQCEGNQELKILNKKFLRGAPFRKRTDLCFECHDETKYKMLDPHNQLNDNGDIVLEKCLYCHIEKPDERVATFQDVKLIGNLDMVCERCHGVLDKHPANANHMIWPSARVLTAIKKVEQMLNVLLPLDNEGKITCVTCHNPHEKGIIPAERGGAKGAGEEFRHRVPGKMCMVCHEN